MRRPTHARLDRLAKQLGFEVEPAVRVVVLRWGESAADVPPGCRVIRQGPPDDPERTMVVHTDAPTVEAAIQELPDDVRRDLCRGRVKLFSGINPEDLV